MIHYKLLLGYILVTYHKNNIVTLHVTFMLYRRNKTCSLGRNQLAREIKQQIKTLINNSWETQLKSLNSKDISIWKMAKTFTKQTSNTIPTIHSTQGLALSNKQKANALAEIFEKVHHLTENMGISRLSQLVNTKYREIRDKEINNENIVYVTPKEIMLAIKSTKPKKAPGPDGIQKIVL